jgi:hypothetical protein
MVSKFSLDEAKLKRKYKQIAGFFFVSSKTGQGIDELKKRIIETTLCEKYMGEKVPEVWLNFERAIKAESATESLITFDRLCEVAAAAAGITERQEIMQAVRFLDDLGSLEYFENESELRDRVIINPQWIVDAFACLVSIKENAAVREGTLLHADIGKVWHAYPPALHTWILKLTEEFDLTFALTDKPMSIVPCLLPEQAPAFDWPELDERSALKEIKVVYNFETLPHGLFNRIQVRMYQFSADTLIWKMGSFFRKNNHIALLLNQPDHKPVIQVQVHGSKPENIVFLIHEVIEMLIADSFSGIKYDFCESLV